MKYTDNQDNKNMFRPIRSYSQSSNYDGNSGYSKSPVSFQGGPPSTIAMEVKSTSSSVRDDYRSSLDMNYKNDLIHGMEQIYPINNRLSPLVEQTRCPKHL